MPAPDDHQIRPADRGELAALARLERRSGVLFTEFGLDLPDDGQEFARLAVAEWIAVVGRPAVGFAAMRTVDGAAHLDQISVHPDHGRRGVGGRLLDWVAARAASRGQVAMTLTTFRDVPWNGPWYARHGFTTLADTDLGPELAAIRAAERAAGLDEVAARVAMRRDLARAR